MRITAHYYTYPFTSLSTETFLTDHTVNTLDTLGGGEQRKTEIKSMSLEIEHKIDRLTGKSRIKYQQKSAGSVIQNEIMG